MRATAENLNGLQGIVACVPGCGETLMGGFPLCFAAGAAEDTPGSPRIVPSGITKGPSVVSRINRCAVCQKHILIHQIRQGFIFSLSFDDPFRQFFF